MGDPLASLIRLCGWRVDERRRAVADLLARLDALAGERQALTAALAHEQALLRQAVDHADAYGYGAYAARVEGEQSRLAAAVAAAEGELSEARQALAEAYRERRKLETVQAAAARRAAVERARREQAVLDEIAQTVRRGSAHTVR